MTSKYENAILLLSQAMGGRKEPDEVSGARSAFSQSENSEKPFRQGHKKPLLKP